MNILLIVNASPWGGSLGVTALRLARAMLARDFRIAAVYFREEGVYHALAGRASDPGTPDMRDAWRELARNHDVPLLLCSAAVQRRWKGSPVQPFREAGLAEVLDTMRGCDRVVTL